MLLLFQSPLKQWRFNKAPLLARNIFADWKLKVQDQGFFNNKWSYVCGSKKVLLLVDRIFLSFKYWWSNTENVHLTCLNIDGVQLFTTMWKSTSNLIAANQEKADKNNFGNVTKTLFSYSKKAGTLQAFEFPPSRGNNHRRQKATWK